MNIAKSVKKGIVFLKLTLGQFEPIVGEKETNLQKMSNIMEQAAKDGSDLVLFPELCLTGYFIQDIAEDMAEPMDGPSIQQMKKLCADYQLHTVFSWAEQGDDGLIYNSACLISDEGNILGNYRKVHVYGRENEVFEKGDSFDVFDSKLGRIGIMICYDADFPEVARILALKGAEIILIPTNNFHPYGRYQRTYVKSRSMENELPVAICNRTGQEQELQYFGESAVYDAHGYELALLGDREESPTIDVPMDTAKDEQLNYLNNRMPSTFGTLTMEDE